MVRAIIGELLTGAQRGFGARMLNGSYYGQALIIWSALIGAAVCAGLMVWQSATAVVFGVTLLLMWEFLVSGLAVPLVILPAPTEI